MSKKCWEIKQCKFMGMTPTEANCPAYSEQVSCWDYSWDKFFKKMPDCSEKEQWRDDMLASCKVCPVRDRFTDKVVKMNKVLSNT